MQENVAKYFYIQEKTTHKDGTHVTRAILILLKLQAINDVKSS